MKNKLVVFLLILLTVVNISALAFMAFHRFAPHPSVPGMAPVRKPGFAKQLALSREQRQQLRAIRRRFRDETAGLRDSLADTHKQLIALLKKDTPDTARIDSLINEISLMQARMHRHAVFSMLGEKSKLTAQQQQKLMRMFERHVGKERMHAPGGMHDRGPERHKGSYKKRHRIRRPDNSGE